MALSLFASPEFGRMEKALDRAFDRAFGSFMPLLSAAAPVGGNAGVWAHTTCPCDITEHKDRYIIAADTPGLTDKDVKIELHDNVLVVSGERATHHEARNNEGKVWRQERTFSKFTRQFALPEDAVQDGITARLEHGVLRVTVPRAAPPAKPAPKRIRVEMVEDGSKAALPAAAAADEQAAA